MEILVGLHNLNRWIIIGLAVLTLVRAYRGWLLKGDWSNLDHKAGVFFGVTIDIQLLTGIILWIFGNWGIKAFEIASNFEGASRMAAMYFAVDHSFTMLVAVIITHLGSIMTKKAQHAAGKHKRAAIFYTVAVILILVAVPWTKRPLIPGF